MLLFLSAAGFFLSFLLIYFNAKRFPSSVYLGFFFLLSSFYGFSQYVVLYSETVSLIAVCYLNMAFLSYLTGPMLYFYVRSLLTDVSRLKWWDLLQFLPAAVILFATATHLATPWEYKTQIAMKIIADRSYVWKDNYILTNQVYPVFINFASRPFLIFLYSLVSFILLFRFSRKKDIHLISKPICNYKWLIGLLSMVALLALAQTALVIWAWKIQDISLFYSDNLLQILSAAATIILIMLPFLNPEILYGFPRTGTALKNTRKIIYADTSDEPDGKKSKLFFSSGYIEMIEEKIISCMKNKKPYLHPEFNIGHFSKITNIPSHHLSYYFKEIKKQSFNDYRNELRVLYAVHLIESGKTREYTLEAIGQMSGFSSRNTFFISFKKYMGVSPGVYASNKG